MKSSKISWSSIFRAIGIKTHGKTLGDEKLVPNIGALDVDVLRRVRRQLGESPLTSKFVDADPAIAEYLPVVDHETLPELPGRPPVLCPGCPHRGFFYALSKFKCVVSGDIGCYSLAVAPPLNCMDTILCMGGGFTVAHGMDCAKNDRPVVGVLETPPSSIPE